MPAETAATAVLDMLRRHYLPEGRLPGGIFAPEIQAPTSARRADLIWQPVTNAGRGQLIGHEIKVSRADVLVELQDPTKADDWQRYCDRWWLVVGDPALVAGLDLPPSWGVLGPPSGRRTRSMTVLVDAPQLTPVDKAPAYEILARWLHWRNHHLAAEHRGCARAARRLVEENEALRRQVPRDPAGRAELDQLVTRIVCELGGPADGTGQVGQWNCRVDVADIVAALRDLGSVYERARAVQFRVEDAHRALRRATAGVSPDAITALAAAIAKIQHPQEVTTDA